MLRAISLHSKVNQEYSQYKQISVNKHEPEVLVLFFFPLPLSISFLLLLCGEAQPVVVAVVVVAAVVAAAVAAAVVAADVVAGSCKFFALASILND